MIRLSPKLDGELATWLDEMWTHYRKELMDSGSTFEEATSNIERNERELFLDGKPNGDQRIFDVIDDDVTVGTLWLAERRDEGHSRGWFVYDVMVDEEFRGRGLGRATMRAAEAYVKSQGGSTLDLNVFGHNAIARRLYESMGYYATSIQMRKDID